MKGQRPGGTRKWPIDKPSLPSFFPVVSPSYDLFRSPQSECHSRICYLNAYTLRRLRNVLFRFVSLPCEEALQASCEKRASERRPSHSRLLSRDPLIEKETNCKKP